VIEVEHRNRFGRKHRGLLSGGLRK
jgi:hypothetical protein